MGCLYNWHIGSLELVGVILARGLADVLLAMLWSYERTILTVLLFYLYVFGTVCPDLDLDPVSHYLH